MIVKGYCNNGDLDIAYEVFHNMVHRGMAKEPIFYNVLLEGCHAHNRIALAAKAPGNFEKNALWRSFWLNSVL